MATKRVELQWVQNVQGLPQLQQLAKIAKEVEDSLNKTADASKKVKTETDAVGTSAVASAAKWAAATAAVTGYLATLKAVTVDSALYAARTQTLTVVTANLARVNNINQAATFGVVEGLKKQGITTQEALGTVNKMIFAQLDLAKAQNIARVAQDAAVIAGVNSSQALEGIIHGIVTRQPEVLRTYGIVVNFEAEFLRASQKLGRQLTDQEKIQIALNAALREGGKIAGTYEAAMTTTGKQLTSLTRFVQEAKNAVGEQLQPALGTVIHSLETMAKFVQENAGGFANLGVGITAASAAALAFRIPAPLPFKIGAAAIAGLGTLALGEQDQKEFIQSQGQGAISSLATRRDALKERLSKGELTPKDADAQSKQLDSLIQQIKAQTANDLAKLFIQRGKGTAFEAERIATGVDLGRGVKVSAGEVLKSIKDIKTGGADITGPLVNQKLLDEQQRQALADQFALKAKAAQKAIQEFYLSSLEKSTDDLQTVLARFLNADSSRTAGFGRVLDKTTTSLTKELEKAFVGSTPIPGVSQKAFAAFNNEMAFAISKIMGERFEKRVKEEAAALAKSLEESGFTDTTKKTVGGLGLSRLNQDESLKAVQNLENQAALAPITRLGFKLQGQGRLTDLESSSDVAKRLDEIKAQAQISSIQRQSSFSTSLVNLGKGQGDDVSAILKAAAIRVKAAQDQFEIERKLAQLTGDSIKLEEAFYRTEEAREQARLDAATQLLELRKKEREEFKQGGERLFDAFKANGTRGIGDFFKTQFVDNTLRTVSGNAAGLSFDFFKQNRLTIPGQGTAQNPNLLGKLLQGTPFGLDPLDALKNVNLKQIDSTNALRLSIDGLNSTIGGSAVGGGRSGSGTAIGSIISQATGIPGLGSLGGLLGPGGTSGFAGPVGGFKSSGSSTGLAASSIPFDPAGVYSLPKTQQSTQSGFSKGLGTAAQVGSGALLAVAGIRQGGARGTLTAISGGLQAAAAIPGPQQPFLQAGALIAGFIGSILPDPRKVREQTIDRILEGAKFDAPISKTREVDLFGRSFDYDSRGAVRIIQTNNFQALDARSLVDRRHDIADMVSMAAADGHSIVQEFKSQITPQ